MRRLLGGSLAAVAAVLLIGLFTGSARATSLDCSEPYAAICAEPSDSIGYGGEYTGHDEPSLLFYSNTPGSGNSSKYSIRLPSDPKVLPNQAGTAGTWNFQLHPAFWLGMALCDNQSAPEFTHAPCVPDSDTNIFDGTNEAAPDYIGRHPGTAFLEVQFYPPGWAPWPPGVSCDASQWCASMAIFSLNQDQNTGVLNNDDCLNTVGLEPVNFAFITKSGVPHAPPSPLGATAATFTPDPATDLFMNSGDQLSVDVHDRSAGLTVIVDDHTTGTTGSMTASAANGFAQILYEPNPSTCHQSPYSFRPMYATSSEHTRVPWAAHSYNVAFSDEIGHFEYCSAVAHEGGECLDNGEPALDGDDDGCFSAAFSLFVPIGGCIATDNDFDGVSYQRVWPGTDPNRGQDKKYHPSPIVFTSPVFNGSQNYDRVAFEADLPRIEAADFGGNCNRFTGVGCVNPPPGSNFYPIYSTGTSTQNPSDNGHCVWQFGGPFIKGTTNTFGGNSAAQYGPLLFSFYPNPNPAIRLRTNNFRNVLSSNPCPA
ncbi:MAG TPA: hypothetical protein VNB46_03250 [Gaiellaceae bacterium]|jgi:hypothetical protein|nr:hypothetical protein [Gaiellaceae bacterium]